ncbi:MAG: hypothetical protein PHU07_06780 [Acidocella sp.]|nr:hypothetical protein [Acidocella sp.]
MRRLPARWRISAVGLVLLAGFAALHACALPAYEFFTRIPDGVAKPHPFVDLRAILQGGACWRAGVNVYTPSACLDGGVFNYSPLLLRAALLPIGPWDTLAGGVLFCLAYMAALARLPPPAGHREFWLRLAASFSPAAYYALEQGNLDVAIFAAVVAVLGLPGRYGVFALAAAAKFYPVALFILALREKRHVVLALGVAGLAALALAVALYGHDLFRAVAIIPSGTPFRASFGRIDLPRGLAMLHLLRYPDAMGWGLALGGGMVAWKLRRGWEQALARLDTMRAEALVAGAAVTLFCFLAAQNVEYRAIFLLLTLPGLCRITGAKRWLALPWVVLALLWEAVPRAMIGGLWQAYLPGPEMFAFWLLRQALWWWLAVEFAALVLGFVSREARRLKN